jgi:hypothetical protein
MSAIMAFQLIVIFVLGCLFGVLMVGLIYRPGVNRGPTLRIRHAFMSGMLVVMTAMLWALVLGVDQAPAADPANFQGPPGIALALGCTAGGGWLALRRRLRNRGIEAMLSQADSNMRVDSVPSAVERQPSGPRRVWTTILRTIDYIVGALLCGYSLGVGALIARNLRGNLNQWLAAVGLHGSLYADVFATAGGLLYSQVVTRAALKALDLALRNDWKMSRRNHYLLAGGPFVYALTFVAGAPGILAGVVLHLVTLTVGYRWTDARPLSPIATLLLLRRMHSASSKHQSTSDPEVLMPSSDSDGLRPVRSPNATS